jgi:hypothetical protein
MTAAAVAIFLIAVSFSCSDFLQRAGRSHSLPSIVLSSTPDLLPGPSHQSPGPQGVPDPVRSETPGRNRRGRADASGCFVGDCLTDKGLEVGTEMPLDGDGTMVEDKITIALAPSAQTEG